MLDPLPQERWSKINAAHLFSRAAFGGSPHDRKVLHHLGRDQGVAAAVDSLLERPVNWDAFPLPAWAANLSNGDTLSETDRSYDFTGWFLAQMVGAPGPAAKMFKFYVDHFPIKYGELSKERRYVYFFRHFDLLRRHALGNFGDLFRAMSFSEGMMQMLSLSGSVRGAVNQNYGREAMELFTLGVNGGYTENDVIANAAAFTGHRLAGTAPYLAYLDETRYTTGAQKGQYRYVDDSPKTLLGQTIHTYQEANDVLLGSPATGRYLAWKLWRYFVAPAPADDLVAALGELLQSLNYEVKPFLRVVFQSAEFYDPANVGALVKDPEDWVVSALKALELPSLPPRTFSVTAEQLGRNVMEPVSIAGWPEPDGEGNEWLGAGAMLSRMNLPLLFTDGSTKPLAKASTVARELPLPTADLNVVIPRRLARPGPVLQPRQQPLQTAAALHPVGRPPEAGAPGLPHRRRADAGLRRLLPRAHPATDGAAAVPTRLMAKRFKPSSLQGSSKSENPRLKSPPAPASPPFPPSDLLPCLNLEGLKA